MLLKIFHLFKSLTFHKLLQFFKLFFLFKFKELNKKIKSSIQFKRNENKIEKIITDISPKLINLDNNYRYFVYKNFNNRNLDDQKKFSKYHSNKGGEWKYNNNKVSHYYADYYASLFIKTDVKNVLEIGIGHLDEDPGGSLRGFRDLYPNANIYGIDHIKDVLFEEERIKTFCVDQYNIDELEDFKKKIGNIKFDLIIDDGAHTYISHVNTFEALFEKITDKGSYVIEDLEFDYLNKYYDYFSNKDIDFKIVEFINLNAKDAQCLIEIKKI